MSEKANDYRTVWYCGGNLHISRYVILGEEECPEEDYDLFGTEISRVALDGIADIAENGTGGYAVFDRRHPHGYNYWSTPAKPVKVFLYAGVKCGRDRKIILSISSGKWVKTWVNGEFICLHEHDGMEYQFFTVDLRGGENYILLEMYIPRGEEMFSVTLRDYTAEVGNGVKALSRCSSVAVPDRLRLVQDGIYDPVGKTHRMMYRTRDSSFFKDYRVEICDSVCGTVREFGAVLGEVSEIGLDELRGLNPETLRYETVRCFFRRRSGETVTAESILLPNDFTARAEDILAEATALHGDYPEEALCGIYGRAGRISGCIERGDTLEYFMRVNEIREITDRLKNGSYRTGEYYEAGVHEIFFRSVLDCGYVRILVRVPEEYDGRRKYPLLAVLSTGNDGGFCNAPTGGMMSEPCICADVTGRGFTGGSYVGEACTLEVINKITSLYSIDRDRIYFAGHSNGGFAAYSVCEAHPDLAAAIYPSVGFPDTGSVKNLFGTQVYQMVSSSDFVFSGRENAVKNRLARYGRYHQYNCREMIHNDFIPYLHNRAIIGKMLKTRLDRYPRTVVFTTERGRNTESFWVRLHGIAYGKKRARIKAEVTDSRTVSLNVRGSDGVTLTLPPTVDRSRFIVTVNSKVFEFTDYGRPTVIFSKKRGGWRVAGSEPETDLRKGNGLLDVYLDSMRLIIPDGAEKYLRDVADSFAHPCTNGIDRKIYVDYPVYEATEAGDGIFSHNLILIDGCHDNPVCGEISELLPVKYDRTGYEYMGRRYDGDYLILQVIPNPRDRTRSVLVVSMNDPGMAKNFLIRKMVLPFNSGGLHPLWNNSVLIYDGKRYYGIYEQGGGIEPADITG